MVFDKIESGILIPVIVGLLTLITNEIDLVFIGLYCVLFTLYFAIMVQYRKFKRKKEVLERVEEAVTNAIKARVLAKISHENGYGHIDYTDADYFGEIVEGTATGFGVFLYKTHKGSCYMGKFLNDNFEGYGEFRAAKDNLIIQGFWKTTLPVVGHSYKKEFGALPEEIKHTSTN